MPRTRTLVLGLVLSVAVLPACGRGTLRLSPLADVPACRTHVSRVSSVTWVEAPGTSERSRDWCDTVGPVYRGTFAAHRDPNVARDAVVVSWNVDVGAGDVEQFVRTIRDEEHAAGRGKPDLILLLQEVYRAGADVPATVRAASVVPSRIARGARAGRDVERLAQALGMNALYVPSMRNGVGAPREDRGNAILSTLPLEDETAIELPLEHQRRVAVGAVVRIGTMPVFVTSVHFDTRRPWFRGSIFAGPAARHRQARALIDALAAARGGIPAIVAGDFNTLAGAREPAIATIQRRFPLVSCGNPLTHQFNLQLDYVFASDAALVSACDRRASRFGSDHHPLVARLRAEAVVTSAEP